MSAVRDIIITGLLLGGIYALVSVGLSLQYGVGRVLNVAHGEFIMIGGFVTFWLWGSTIQLNALVSLVITAPLVFVIGWLLHSALFRRIMHKAPNLDVFEGQSMLAAFGLLYVVQNIARIIWGSQTYQINYLNTTVTGAQIPVNRLVALGVVIVVGALFYLFLARTRMGKAIRSSAQDPSTAGLMGVNINSVLAICFGLGLAMAGIAGSLLSFVYPIQTSMGLQYTVIAMIVVVLGGLGSISGAMIGGVILGIVSQLVTYFQPTWTMIAYYVVFVVLLLARPKGIMGK
ncbi:MAG: branched-chain amino acid ABC transporter permease [Thermoleophilia bacterium]|nr:branched-chain amino acid ABC transporter permease [Thermoleophilia bacterium]